MNCSIRGMKCANVVKIVRNRAHLHHAIAIICRQTLDLGAPTVVEGLANSSCVCTLKRCSHSLPVLEPDLHLPGAKAWNFS